MSRTLTYSLAALATALTACASAPVAPEAPLTPYACTGDVPNLLADYYTTGSPRAVLHIFDKQTTFYLAPSSNGTRYTTGQTDPNEVLQRSDAPGERVWWVKGSEAILFEVAERADGTTYEKQLAVCTSKPQPLPAPSLRPMPSPTGTQLPGTIPGTAPTLTTQPVTI